MYGSAAPKYNTQPRQVRPVQTEEHVETRTKAAPVNMLVFILSLIAFAAIGFMMIQYIRLSSEITVLTSSITSLESQVDALRMENDEYYGRIMSNIDLEEVREIAIAELGMDYATADQIITYDSRIDDYVEQRIVIKE
jgi:cell division protein FtsL